MKKDKIKDLFNNLSEFMSQLVKSKHGKSTVEKVEPIDIVIHKKQSEVVANMKKVATLDERYYRTSKGDMTHDIGYADFMASQFLFFKEWKKNGIIDYDDSLEPEVDSLIERLQDIDSWRPKSAICIKEAKVTEAVELMKRTITGVYSELPEESYLKSKADTCLEMLNKIDGCLKSAGKITVKGSGLFSFDDSSVYLDAESSQMVMTYMNVIKRTSEELKDLQGYFERTKLKGNKAGLKNFEERYLLHDSTFSEIHEYSKTHGISFVEAEKRLNFVRNTWEKMAGFGDLVDDAESSPIRQSGYGLDVFKRIDAVVNATTIMSEPMQKPREYDVNAMILELARDPKFNEILEKKDGMTQEDFDYVYEKVTGGISSALSESYLGSAFNISYAVKSPDDKWVGDNLGFMKVDNRLYTAMQVRVDKNAILEIDNKADFSRYSLRHLDKLTLAQKQFAYLFMVITHETSHAVDYSLQNLNLREENAGPQKRFIEDYLDLDSLTKLDLVLLSGISPSLSEKLETAFNSDEKIEIFIKALGMQRYLETGSEQFARKYGTVSYTDCLNSLAKAYLKLGETDKSSMVEKMVKDADFVCERVYSGETYEAITTLCEVLEDASKDLVVAQDVENLEKLCLDYSLTNLRTEDVSLVERKAHGLVGKYYTNLPDEEKRKLGTEAVRAGKFRLLMVCRKSGETPETRVKNESMVQEAIDGASTKDIVSYYRRIGEPTFYKSMALTTRSDAEKLFKDKAKDLERFAPVLEELKKDKKVAEVLAFINGEDVFFTMHENLGRLVGDIDGWANWLNSLPQTEKDSKNYPELLTMLGMIVEKTELNNHPASSLFLERIKEETNKARFSGGAVVKYNATM